MWLTGNLSPKDESTEEPSLLCSTAAQGAASAEGGGDIKAPSLVLSYSQAQRQSSTPTAPVLCIHCLKLSPAHPQWASHQGQPESPSRIAALQPQWPHSCSPLIANTWTSRAGKENWKASTLGCWDVTVLTQVSRWLFFCSNGKCQRSIGCPQEQAGPSPSTAPAHTQSCDKDSQSQETRQRRAWTQSTRAAWE